VRAAIFPATADSDPQEVALSLRRKPVHETGATGFWRIG